MALDYPGVKTVQIIFNIFRQKPAEEFFPLAEERDVGVLARVPLASGLLSGKMTADREFSSDDHRNFNRDGQAFDQGETFSGVPFETGPAGRGGAEGAGARGLHPGPARPALDPDAPGGFLRHPRRQAARIRSRTTWPRPRCPPSPKRPCGAFARSTTAASAPRSTTVVNEGGAGRPRVLLTGATGYIAGQLLPDFRERYELRLIDVREETPPAERVDGVEIADLRSDDDAKLRPLFEWAEVVVHCGHLKPEGEDLASLYEGERRNLDMMQRVYRLAMENGVRRVVAASTNQAAKWYEQPYYAGLKDRVDPEDYPRPDSFYGWAKAAWEPLGFLYACGSLGRKLEVVQIRIVVPRSIDARRLRRRAARALRARARGLHQRA